MKFIEFKQRVNIDYLNENINEMLKYNIPFPIELVFLIENEDIQKSIHMLYFLKAKNYKTWYNMMKRTDEGDMEYYDYSYKKLLEYVTKLPQFKELIKR